MGDEQAGTFWDHLCVGERQPTQAHPNDISTNFLQVLQSNILVPDCTLYPSLFAGTVASQQQHQDKASAVFVALHPFGQRCK
jgi:hypothetical protein